MLQEGLHVLYGSYQCSLCTRLWWVAVILGDSNGTIWATSVALLKVILWRLTFPHIILLFFHYIKLGQHSVWATNLKEQTRSMPGCWSFSSGLHKVQGFYLAGVELVWQRFEFHWTMPFKSMSFRLWTSLPVLCSMCDEGQMKITLDSQTSC